MGVLVLQRASRRVTAKVSQTFNTNKFVHAGTPSIHNALTLFGSFAGRLDFSKRVRYVSITSSSSCVLLLGVVSLGVMSFSVDSFLNFV